MADGLQRDDAIEEFELASRLLLRKLNEANEEMAAAEPGTDDFLGAYQESRRLRELYQQVRETWQVPAEVWSALPSAGGAGSQSQGRPIRQNR